MGAVAILLWASAVSAVPLLSLLLLGLSGALASGPALAAAAAILAAGLGLAAIWARDLALVEETLRLAAAEDAAALAAAAVRPRLPPLARLALEIERLSRSLADRAAEVGRMRRADAAIIERLPDPLIVLGADRSVRRANAAAREAFGAEIASVLRHPTLRAALDRALAQGVAQRAEMTLPVPVPREVHATLIVLDPPLADGGQAIAVLSDRTRDRAVERMRADFVANASHELRTPLTSLIGFIHTLRGPAADDPPAQARFLRIMAEQAERMNRLIDDLLSLSRIELTEHRPPSQLLELTPLVHRIAAGFEPTVAARTITLDVAVARDLPVIVGDEDQLAQVLQNLLDNAVKYGREGGTVRLSVTRAGSDARWPARPGIVLSVTDDGQGIAREHIPRLTERFYRADKGRSRAVGGTGLGLAIVKHIVNRHRGRLVVESVEGEGSTFLVWLPAASILSEPGRVATAAARSGVGPA
jgi:two-component system phosphate regulon sensor histidine kinase PhoR